MPGRFAFTQNARGQVFADRGVGGRVVVIDVAALLGLDLDVLGALALVGDLIGHGVNGFLEGGVGGALDPVGAVALEEVAVHLLGVARQEARGEDGAEQEQAPRSSRTRLAVASGRMSGALENRSGRRARLAALPAPGRGYSTRGINGQEQPR